MALNKNVHRNFKIHWTNSGNGSEITSSLYFMRRQGGVERNIVVFGYKTYLWPSSSWIYLDQCAVDSNIGPNIFTIFFFFFFTENRMYLFWKYQIKIYKLWIKIKKKKISRIKCVVSIIFTQRSLKYSKILFSKHNWWYTQVY